MLLVLLLSCIVVSTTFGCEEHQKLSRQWRRSDDNEKPADIENAESAHYPVFDKTGKRFSQSFTGNYGQYGKEAASITLMPDGVSVTCTVKDPLEHIVWLRARCPDEYERGDVIAKGAISLLPSLYAVSVNGEDGVYTSTLSILQPRSDGSGGVFRCEAWPHPGNNRYRRDVVLSRQARGLHDPWNAIVLGGAEMIEECFYGSYGEKWRQFRALGNIGRSLKSTDIKTSASEVNYQVVPKEETQVAKSSENSKQSGFGSVHFVPHEIDHYRNGKENKLATQKTEHQPNNVDRKDGQILLSQVYNPNSNDDFTTTPLLLKQTENQQVDTQSSQKDILFSNIQKLSPKDLAAYHAYLNSNPSPPISDNLKTNQQEQLRDQNLNTQVSPTASTGQNNQPQGYQGVYQNFPENNPNSKPQNFLTTEKQVTQPQKNFEDSFRTTQSHYPASNYFNNKQVVPTSSGLKPQQGYQQNDYPVNSHNYLNSQQNDPSLQFSNQNRPSWQPEQGYQSFDEIPQKQSDPQIPTSNYDSSPSLRPRPTPPNQSFATLSDHEIPNSYYQNRPSLNLRPQNYAPNDESPPKHFLSSQSDPDIPISYYQNRPSSNMRPQHSFRPNDEFPTKQFLSSQNDYEIPNSYFQNGPPQNFRPKQTYRPNDDFPPKSTFLNSQQDPQILNSYSQNRPNSRPATSFQQNDEFPPKELLSSQNDYELPNSYFQNSPLSASPGQIFQQNKFEDSPFKVPLTNQQDSQITYLQSRPQQGYQHQDNSHKYNFNVQNDPIPEKPNTFLTSTNQAYQPPKSQHDLQNQYVNTQNYQISENKPSPQPVQGYQHDNIGNTGVNLNDGSSSPAPAKGGNNAPQILLSKIQDKSSPEYKAFIALLKQNEALEDDTFSYQRNPQADSLLNSNFESSESLTKPVQNSGESLLSSVQDDTQKHTRINPSFTNFEIVNPPKNLQLQHPSGYQANKFGANHQLNSQVGGYQTQGYQPNREVVPVGGLKVFNAENSAYAGDRQILSSQPQTNQFNTEKLQGTRQQSYQPNKEQSQVGGLQIFENRPYTRSQEIQNNQPQSYQQTNTENAFFRTPQTSQNSPSQNFQPNKEILLSSLKDRNSQIEFFKSLTPEQLKAFQPQQSSVFQNQQTQVSQSQQTSSRPQPRRNIEAESSNDSPREVSLPLERIFGGLQIRTNMLPIDRYAHSRLIQILPESIKPESN